MLKLASWLGFAFAVADLKRRARALAARGVLGVAGFAVLLIALCFLLVALHLWLSGLINPIASAAIIGGALLVIALVLFFAASRPIAPAASSGGGGESPAEPIAEALRQGTSKLSDALGGGERSPLANPVLLMAGLAVLVGFLFGRRGSRRDKDE